MHLPRVTVGPAHDHDDDWLLETIAISMAHIDPRSLAGAPVLVAELRPRLVRHFPGIADFAAALLRLERSDRLTLIRRDPAFPAADGDEVNCIRDEALDVIGVALR
jgi:hypothetical protein